MLTKEHIKARVRGKKIVPDFIELKDKGADALAASLLSSFADAEGETIGALKERAAEVGGDNFTNGAFFKLIVDRCKFDDFDDAYEEQRWELLKLSQKIRNGTTTMTAEQFRAAIVAERNEPYQKLQANLYADLPEFKKVKSVETLESKDLINRYNIAQIQGLLLKCHTLVVTISSDAGTDLRYLFHQIKFHRLLAELSFDKKKKKTIITLSGPLAQFDQAATYGMQLAVFFPHLLSLGEWTAVAEIEHKRGKIHTLSVGNTTGLLPIYKVRSSFVPPEFHLFIDTFNGLSKDLVAERGGAVVNLGQEQYVIPDVTITNRLNGLTYALELFHKWHAAQLKNRLSVLEQGKNQGVLLGVARSIAKTAEVEKSLKESCWFGKNGFLFSEFPTAKAVFSLMTKICRDD
jgi:predicted nuclease of restriction endonuclease-like RecB superfamily